MLRFLAGALVLALSLPACAALDIGERAPNFTTDAALGGSVYRYSLADSLKKGPVVLYFFPAAFSEGCSAEAHFFADGGHGFGVHLPKDLPGSRWPDLFALWARKHGG